MFQNCSAQYFNLKTKKANVLGDTIVVAEIETMNFSGKILRKKKC